MHFDAQAAREKKRAALMSLLAALFLTTLKVVVGLSTGSLGVLAEAAHSALDLVAAGVTFLAVRLATLPADKRHAYGHGKAENLAALAETLLLLFTCGWIVHEAVDRLFFHPSPVRVSFWAFAVMAVSIAVDFNRARLLGRVAKKHKSQALEADALHFSTDIVSSGVVILGLAAVWAASFAAPGGLLHTALLRADSVAALIVAVIVAWVSLRLGARAVDVLLDAGDRDSFKKIEEAVATVPDVLRINKLRLRQSGSFIFADMELVLPAGASLEYSHAVTEAVERAVRAVLPDADVTIHFEPDDPGDDPAGRIRKLGTGHGLDVHGVELYTADNGNFITLHAAVEPETPLANAHRGARAFEEELRRRGYQVLTHIEPRRPTRCGLPAAELSLPDEERRGVAALIEAALAEEPLAGRYHQLVILDLDGDWSLSFHCCLPGGLSVEIAHQVITRIEKRLYKRLPKLSRISIHPDVLEED